jgi:hypothetical protein
MTIRHIVLFAFPGGRNATYLKQLDAGLAELVANVPDIAHASWGEDVTGSADNHDFALVMDFADRDAYQRYRTHPAHRHFIETFMRSMPVTKVRAQYQFDQKDR